jgi:starvation-inducible DNA-binding protein
MRISRVNFNCGYHTTNEEKIMSKVKAKSPINIGIAEKDRQKIAAGLARMLADSYTLYLKTHNFHWNVTGPMFQTLHLMFMAQYQEFAALTSIVDSVGVPNAKEMIRQLVIGQEIVVRTAREVFPIAERAGDQPTADLLTQRMTVHEQNAWMLRSLLEE